MSTTTPPPPPTSGASNQAPNAGHAAQSKASSSGALSVLEHTGIPASWLKRPKLPSRNWLIFWGVVSSTLYLYWDDRRQCKAIRNEYIDRVKHLADAPLGSMDQPRKVQIFACRWPGDDEYDRSMKFFRRYVKPIFVAAAVDYEAKNGNQHGALSSLIQERAQERRLEDLGRSPPKPWQAPKTDADRRRDRERQMEGGTVLIGRHTFKEYMHGLKRGWTESLVKVDEEEVLANALQDDGRFDEVDEEIPTSLEDSPSSTDETSNESSDLSKPISLPRANPAQPHLSTFSPWGQIRSSPAPRPPPTSSPTPAVPDYMNIAPNTIPPQPPLLLVYYPNRLGFRNIPLMIVDFFNERRNVRIGCEAAFRLVMAQTRPFNPPTSSLNDPYSPSESSTTPNDIDFAVDSEKNYGRSYEDTLKTIEHARKGYYSELPKKLATARALARNEREPTKDEIAYPPMTEVELRAQRLKKEKRWREDEAAYEFLKKEAGVAWDPRFDGALSVFRDPTPEEEASLRPPPPPADDVWESKDSS